eukprot:gene6393-6625_t
MTLLGALDELSKRSSQLVTSDCLGYRPDPSSTATKAQMCSGTCDRVTPQLAMGKFEYRPITTAWKAQRHIREFGGVISKFQVFVVGYDLEQEYFYVKNSWGANWGEDGYFRVAFGCCGLLEEAYGLVFVPHQQPPAAQLPVTTALGNANCFLYQARPGDNEICYPAEARKQKSMSYYFTASGFYPDKTVFEFAETDPWPGKDYADGKFCTDDELQFEYSDAHKMKCDGENQLMRSFWRMAVPVEGFTANC